MKKYNYQNSKDNLKITIIKSPHVIKLQFNMVEK